MTKIHYDTDYQQLNGRNTSRETFRKRQGTIDCVLYSIEATQKGIQHYLRLEVAPTELPAPSPLSPLHYAQEFSYRDEKNITELLTEFKVTKPQDLYGKNVTVYLQQSFWKAGISLPAKEPTKLPVIRS
ncbi:hypothetical protein HY485_00910 [Candidatus Woesearchaeota archaeon]|nr:hypothetical protein [Candidatus Woesearchaeota archaeon]